MKGLGLLKKGMMLAVVFVLGIMTLCSCSKKNKEDEGYASFQNDYDNVLENFEVEGFEAVGEGELKYSCVRFPENEYFEEVEDLVDGEATKPVKKNLYYLNKEKSILIYISHMYLEEEHEKQMLTIDVPADEYSEVAIPYFEEFFMMYRHNMVSLKIISLKEKKIEHFNEIADNIFQSYASILK